MSSNTPSNREPGARLVHLDMARGLAALAVCAEHLRSFHFVEYGKVTGSPNLFDKLFYLVTGLGHQAVMIFFVLSGYFVGGSVLKDMTGNRWSWFKFGSRRVTRLFVVLMPALLLTLFWDSLGRMVSGGAGYDGTLLSFYHSGPGVDGPAEDGFKAFFGNMFFLQTILVPVYGSNGPLWSLSYEFWYYLMFPLAMMVFHRGLSWFSRGGYALLFASCAAFLPWGILESGLIWLMGCGVFWCSRHVAINEFLSRKLVFMAGGAAFLAALLLSRREGFVGSDFLIGISFAFTMPYLIKINSASRFYSSTAVGLSDISYTLYLAHFPILAFFFFSFRPGRQMNPSPAGYGEFIFLLFVVLVYAALLWWMFERRTDSVRRVLERKLQMR